MGYRRRKYSSRAYGSEHAKWHLQQAEIFSSEVGGADYAVKEAFFSLSGKALDYLLEKYGELYGSAAQDYARKTIPKWRTKQTGMSGMVAQRLFKLLPPLMPTDQKHKVFEAIWKSYGPSSQHYLYLGPDSDASAVIKAIDDHFESLNLSHKIPSSLEHRFDWLSDNDVTVKKRLLDHFLSEQRKAANATAALHVPMMLQSMNEDVERKISKLSHTAFAGNHQIEIKADPLRSGFVLSASPYGMTRPPINWTKGLGTIAAIVALVAGGIFVLNSQNRTPTASSGLTQSNSTQSQVGVGQDPDQQITAIPPVPRLSTSQAKIEPARPPTRRAAIAPVVAPNASAHSPAVAPAAGCSDTSISGMSDNGATVNTASGLALQVSIDGIMRIQAAQWSTGDSIVVCTSKDSGGAVYASISNPSHFDKIQAIVASASAPTAVFCDEFRIVRVADDGASVVTTDGTSYQVSTGGIMRIQAAQWSTGDDVQVCRSGAPRIGAPASIANAGHFDKIQVALVARGQSASVTCRRTSVSSVSDGGTSVGTSDGSSYTIASYGIMRIQTQQWSTGDAITVCESHASDGSVPAALANAAHFDKVQATKS